MAAPRSISTRENDRMAARTDEAVRALDEDDRAARRAIYRDDGRTLFCRVCLCSIVPGTVREHERQNPERHAP